MHLDNGSPQDFGAVNINQKQFNRDIGTCVSFDPYSYLLHTSLHEASTTSITRLGGLIIFVASDKLY